MTDLSHFRGGSNSIVHSAPRRGQICQHRAATGSLSLDVAVVIWNRLLRPRFTASPQPQLLSAQSRVRCKVIHTTHALVGAARNQPAGRSGSQPVSSSEVVSVTNLRVLSGSTSRCRCCSCCCRHVLSLSTLSTNGWSFAEPHPASGSARDEFLCSLDPSPRPDLARRSDQGITGFGMFTDDTDDTRLTRPGLPRGGGGAPNQQERTGTNKPCLAFLA